MRRLALLPATILALLAPAHAEDGPGITLPADYRDWPLITVAREQGALNDIRAILGNPTAIAAARAGTLPYPDGTIIARLAWSYDKLPESQAAFRHPQSFIAGTPRNGVQLMVKESTKYAATGGWGYAQFKDGKPAAEAKPEACFACHKTVAARDFVFNRYAS
jgi:hypothetical protein